MGACLTSNLSRPLWTVHAQHHECDASLHEPGVCTGQLAHLPSAVWSPPTTIEDEQDRLAFPIVGERDDLSIGRGQREIRRDCIEREGMFWALSRHSSSNL